MVKLFGKGDQAGIPGAKKSNKQVIRFPSVGAALSANWKVVDKYPLNAPFAYAVIAEDAGNGSQAATPVENVEAAEAPREHNYDCSFAGPLSKIACPG